MIKALEIPVIQIPVRDIEKSVAWYRDILGLGFTFDYSPGDDEAWMNVNGGIGFGLVRCHTDIPKLHFYNTRGELSPILTFRVENIHEVYEELKAKDVQVGEMNYKEEGGYGFAFHDPDGHISYLWGGWPKND